MLLAIDTATTTASLALYDLGAARLLGETTWEARRRHTQDTLLVAQRLLAQVGKAPAQITALAVATGPGSFTGVRIGISAAKGIGLGLPCSPRVVGVPTLMATAAPWAALAAAAPPLPAVFACIQAGRGRYNWACFPAGELRRRPAAGEHSAGDAGEFAAALAGHAGPVWLAGEVAQDLRQEAARLAHVHIVDNVSAWRRAGHLARLAAELLSAGTEDALASLQPIYLRAP